MLKLVALAANTLADGGNDVKSGLADKIASFFDFMIGRIPSWIAGFVVFALAIFVSKLAKTAVESRISDQVDEEHQEVLVLAGRVTYFGTLAVGITVALKIAGIDLTTLLAAVAFGIGFALRDLIMNFLAGVMILLGKQFRIGDFIKVGSTFGRVMEIQTRATILKAVDGTKVIVPNSEIFTKQVVSTTANPLRRVDIPVYVSYDTDISYATKIVIGYLKRQAFVFKKPSPTVIVKDYGDSTLDLAARCWVESGTWFKNRNKLMQGVWEQLNKAGIYVPYNIVHVEKNQDTAADIKEYEEITKQRKEKMAAAKAKKEAAKAALAAQPVQPNGNLEQQAVALPTDPLTQAPVPATAITSALAEVTVEPEGAYQDLSQIDSQG
ncbi:mechanosensitive ion channel family protein [Candidatus Peregrinibacteria bacterium]|nr:mechanosensitive ion channel family protein [Candidatus Peregrinibacteria bacterium]